MSNFLNEYHITVDLKRGIAQANTIPAFVQNDSAVIYVKILDNGKPYDYANADRYVFSFRRFDGQEIQGLGSYDTETGTVKYELGSTEMHIEGNRNHVNLECAVQLYLGTTRVTTRSFNIRIHNDYQEAIESSKDLTLLQELFIEVDQVKSDTIDAANFATEQGNFAKGIRDNFGHKGVYDNTKVYKDGNVVSYGGINYMCILETTAGINPTNGTYWTVVSPQATINEQTWTSTANQRTFTITNGQYVVGKGNLEVWVGGVQQLRGQSYEESSETTFTFYDNLVEGLTVYAKWFEGHMYIAKGHQSSHAMGGQDEIDVTQLKNFKENVTDKFTTVDAQLAERTTPKKFDLADSKGKGLDIVDVIQDKISQGYNWFVVPKRTRLNKTLQLLNVYNIVFEGVGGFEPEFELNTGGIGIKVEGSSFIMFKNMTIGTRVISGHFAPITLDNPSTIGIMYTRSLQEDSCQWNNSENLTIYMHNDPAANGGKGTIGLYNCTAESQSYNNPTIYADVPLVVTRTDIYGLAVKRSPSMKAVHFAGATTLIATGGHALVLEGVSDVTFDNLYMAKDIFYGSNNEQYGCLITGAAEQGYENYNIVFLNYDCEEFASGFKVVSRLRHSKIFGNQHAPVDRIISVETIEAVMDNCEIDIQITNNPAVIDLVYFDSLCAGAINSKFNMFKDTYRLTCNKPLMGCTVFANGKPNIVNNHGGHQSVNVFSKVGIGVNNNHINFSYNKPTPSDGSPFSSGMFPGNFAFNINTQVGSPAGWICNGSDYFEVGQVGSRQFDHNPTNVETPIRLGEEVFDWMGQKWYKSVGLNIADWRAMTV